MTELTYTRMEDYLVPDLTLDNEDEQEEYPLGKYWRLRETFLKEHHHGTYTSRLLTGRLESHLREIDRQAQEQESAVAAPAVPPPGPGQCFQFVPPP